MEEIWKDIPSYEGKYQASNLGSIRSIDFFINHWRGGQRVVKGRCLKFGKTGSGYLATDLGKRKTRLVHRLVVITFIPNRHNKPCVNHINGIKTDNRIENLEWVTYSENERHSYRVLGKKNNTPGKGLLGAKSPTAKKINRYSISGDLIKSYGSITDACRDLNINPSSISENLRGVNKTCLKTVFKYVE